MRLFDQAKCLFGRLQRQEQGLSLFLRRLRGKQGLYLIWDQERVIFLLEIFQEMILTRWVTLQLRSPPKHHLLLEPNSLQKLPLERSRGRRELKL